MRSVSCGLRVPEREERAQLQWVGAAGDRIPSAAREVSLSKATQTDVKPW